MAGIPHPYYQAIIDANRAAGRPGYHELSPEEGRALLRAAMAAAPAPKDLPPLEKVENLAIVGDGGAIPARIYTPSGPLAGTIIYFHSGGWVIGDLDFCDSTCRRLAGLAGARLISVEYRKAPEHPFPQPLNDAWTALCWAAAQWPGRLVVAGESAGGNLAAACAIRSRERKGPSIAGQLLAYPVTDHDFTTPSYRELGEREVMLSRADMRWFWDQYCPSGIDRNQAEIAPLRLSNASGLPPAMILTAELDPLRDEGLAYATLLARSGVSVTARCDPGMLHGYLAAAGSVPTAANALRDAARWIHERLIGDGDA